MTVRIDSYVSPDSWDDLSMDWNNPQAQDARFVDALCRAIYERYKIFFTLLYPERGRITLPQITPDRRLDYSKLLTIHNATLALVSKFLDINTSVSEMTVEKTANGR